MGGTSSRTSDNVQVPTAFSCQPESNASVQPDCLCCSDCGRPGQIHQASNKVYRDWADRLQASNTKTKVALRPSNLLGSARISKNGAEEIEISRTRSLTTVTIPLSIEMESPSAGQPLRRATRSFNGALPKGWDAAQLQKLEAAVEVASQEQGASPPGFRDMQALIKAHDLGTRTPLKAVYGNK